MLLALCLQEYTNLIRMVVTRIRASTLNDVCVETLNDHLDMQHCPGWWSGNMSTGPSSHFFLSYYGNIWHILFIRLFKSQLFESSAFLSLKIHHQWPPDWIPHRSGQASSVTACKHLRFHRLVGCATERNISRMRQIISEKEHGAQVTFPGEYMLENKSLQAYYWEEHEDEYKLCPGSLVPVTHSCLKIQPTLSAANLHGFAYKWRLAHHWPSWVRAEY